jgi:hypothetical protein
MWKAPVYRASYQRKYGSRCFLRPRDKSYPICSHGKIDCKGLRAAQYYLRLNKRTMNKRSANKMSKRARALTRKYCK